MTPREACIAFNMTENIGSVGVGKLAAVCGGVVGAWEQYPKKVARSGGEVNWESEIKKAAHCGVQIVTPEDASYPDILKRTSGHPLALYVSGNVAALSGPCISIVGTRRTTPYGRDHAFKIAKGLAANGWTIVSGLAEGIDAEAHRGALEAGGTTVGILGSALDKFFPDANRELAREIVRKGGAVVSEFPFGREPDRQTFPQRNHIVAALARGVVAIEAPLKSGTLITTGLAADLGRTVMALPGRVDSRSSAGCLALIRDGARLIRSADDVLDEMASFTALTQRIVQKQKAKAENAGDSSEEESADERVPAPEPQYNLEEALIMRHVEMEGITIDDLVRKTHLPAARVNSLCMTLRMKGRVRFFPGNRVALPRAD